MVSSLKDALLGAGIKAPEPKPEPTRPKHPVQRGSARQPHSAGPGSAQTQRKKHKRKLVISAEVEPSLADAYRARTAQEQRERDLAKRKKEEEAKAKKERLAAVDALLAGQARNDDTAEDSRYFEYSRKIRRVYVTAAQQEAITRGELGIVQSKGTYVLVDAEVAKAVAALAPEYLALLQEPEGPAGDPAATAG